MAASIPPHPSISLGSVISADTLDLLQQMSALQGPVDAAQDTLHSFVALRRSLEMTLGELLSMNVDVGDLNQELAEVGKSLAEAATAYAGLRRSQEAQLQPLRARLYGLDQAIESPLDFDLAKIKRRETSADSLKLDSQYFSYLDGEQTEATMSNIRKFLTASMTVENVDNAAPMISTGMDQISKQRQLHSLAGTLIITASCTHRTMRVIFPLALDPDLSVSVWNRVFTADEDQIKVSPYGNIQRNVRNNDPGNERALSIVSGAVYGSDFIGMAHVLRQDSAATDQMMDSASDSIQKLEIKAATNAATGGLGAGDTSDILNVLGNKDTTAHVTILSTGAIPSVTAHKMTVAASKFAEFDSNVMMNKLSTLANATGGSQSSIRTSSQVAKVGRQMAEFQGSTVLSVLAALEKSDESLNSMLNVRSLMTAFEDFIASAGEGEGGAPVRYLTHPITRAEIVKAWNAKYQKTRSASDKAGATDAGG